MDITVRLTLTLACVLALATAAGGHLCNNSGGRCYCTELSVACNDTAITSVPTDLPPNTTELVITNGNIPIIKSFPEYKHLTTLRITHSNVRYIADGAFKLLTKVDHLVLTDNELTSLWPETFAGLSSLQILSLERNPIHMIKNHTFSGRQTPKLTYLKLSYCEIFKIEPDAFKRLINLEELYIDNNQLHAVPKIGSVIGDVEMLKVLDLNTNHINQINGDPFTQLGHLKSLYLQNNKLHYLSRITFSGLSSLQTLNLGHNDIVLFHNDTFNQLASLKDLDLSYNRILELRREMLPRNVSKLHLHHNQWNCSCSLSWMLTAPMVVDTNSHTQSFTCNTPAALGGKQLLNLSREEFCPYYYSPAGVNLGLVLAVVLSLLLGGILMYIIVVVYRKRQRKYRQQLSVPYSQVNRETELFSI